jgi:hypothetical protein
MLADIHAAGRNLVQERLPDMRARFLDKGDFRLTAFAEAVAKTRSKLQPARSATDNDDVMQVALWPHWEHGLFGRRSLRFRLVHLEAF